MSPKEKLSRYALDVSRFAGTSSHELALVVHLETETQRAIEAQEFEANKKTGNLPAPTNALMSMVEPYDWSTSKPWDEYAKNIDVLERCDASLGVPAGEVAKRIVSELHPKNWEVIFWIGAWLQVVDEKADAEVQRQQMLRKLEQAKMDRSKAATDAANAKHCKMAKVQAYAIEEWALNKAKYKGNRTQFAKCYVEVIQEEFGIEVAQKTIHATWLKGR
jgi:hypothetical protein